MICLVWGAGIVCLLCVLFGMMHLVWGVRHKVVDMVFLVWDNFIVVSFATCFGHICIILSLLILEFWQACPF